MIKQDGPLTDADLNRLADFLKGCNRGKAMNLEELDEFFAALIAGPDVVLPSEYLPEVYGGEMSENRRDWEPRSSQRNLGAY